MTNEAWPIPVSTEPLKTTWPFPEGVEPLEPVIFENILREHNITVTHVFYALRNRGGVTLAWRSCNTHRNTRMVEVAVAYCHPDDNYVRKVGSRLAVDRFLAGNTVIVPARTGNTASSIIDTLKMMFWTSIQDREVEWDLWK